MTSLWLLIGLSLALGLFGLGAFLWTITVNQYDDLDGDAQKILYDEDLPRAATNPAKSIN